MRVLGTKRLTDESTDLLRLILATAVRTGIERGSCGNEVAVVSLVCVYSWADALPRLVHHHSEVAKGSEMP